MPHTILLSFLFEHLLGGKKVCQEMFVPKEDWFLQRLECLSAPKAAVELFTRHCAAASYGFAIGHQSIEFELGHSACVCLQLRSTCLVVASAGEIVSDWLCNTCGRSDISLQGFCYFMNIVADSQLLRFMADKPLATWTKILLPGEVFYMPVGLMVSTQVRNVEDCLALRMGVSSRADVDAYHWLSNVNAGPVVDYAFKHLEAAALPIEDDPDYLAEVVPTGGTATPTGAGSTVRGGLGGEDSGSDSPAAAVAAAAKRPRIGAEAPTGNGWC